MAEKMVVGVSP